MERSIDYVLGIDPDVEKSGIALLDAQECKYMLVGSMSFPEVYEYMRDCLAFLAGKRIKVVIEAGWRVKKSNYHKAQGHRAERIAKNVGENHGTGKQLLAMARHIGMDAHAVYPLTKTWKGRDGKITQEELASFAPIPKRTNQDARDAALLAWVHAELPIRIVQKSSTTN